MRIRSDRAILFGVMAGLVPAMTPNKRINMTGTRFEANQAENQLVRNRSAKWQATSRPSINRAGGRSCRHRSTAWGQRVENTQPFGGSSGDGNSPFGTPCDDRRPSPGVDASSAWV